MPAGSVPIGVPCILDPNITAPANGVTFSFEPDPDGGDFSAIFQPTGTVTTLVASLQISLDGGVTWGDYIASGQFFPASTTLNKVVTPIIAGALYRINYQATTAGAIVMRVCSN